MGFDIRLPFNVGRCCSAPVPQVEEAMKNSFRTVLFALIVGLTTQAGAQGSFQNLNFEQAALYVTPTPVDTWGDFFLPTACLPRLDRQPEHSWVLQ